MAVIVNNHNLSSLPQEAFTTTHLRLRITQPNMDPELVKPLLANTNVKSLGICCMFTRQDESWIIELIRNNLKLESLTLSRIHLSVGIMNAVKDLTSLKKFRIKGVVYYREGAIMIPQVIERATMLEEFSIDCLVSYAVESICRAIAHHKSLSRLTVDVLRETTIWLDEILKHNTQLTHLSMVECGSDWPFFRDYMKVVNSAHPNVVVTCDITHIVNEREDVDFQSCPKLFIRSPAPSLDYIDRKLAALPQLTELEIEAVTDDNIPSLIKILEVNPDVTYVVINFIACGSLLPKFMDALAHITHLTIREQVLWDYDVVYEKLRGHQYLERLNVQSGSLRTRPWNFVDLVQSMPRLYHLGNVNDGDSMTENMLAAKTYCQLRKQRHKAHEPTLVNRLLPKFYEL